MATYVPIYHAYVTPTSSIVAIYPHDEGRDSTKGFGIIPNSYRIKTVCSNFLGIYFDLHDIIHKHVYAKCCK